MITITLKHELKPEQEQWLAKNVGPRLHYLHNSIGGQGWIAKKQNVIVQNDKGGTHSYRVQWNLTFQDDRHATIFTIMFSS